MLRCVALHFVSFCDVTLLYAKLGDVNMFGDTYFTKFWFLYTTIS